MLKAMQRLPTKISIENCGQDVMEERYSASRGCGTENPRVAVSQAPRLPGSL